MHFRHILAKIQPKNLKHFDWGGPGLLPGYVLGLLKSKTKLRKAQYQRLAELSLNYGPRNTSVLCLLKTNKNFC